MTIPIVKRYIVTLDKYKYIPLITFILGVGVSSAIGMKSPPPPTYQAQGILAGNSPPVMFSATGTQIQTQGAQLTEEMLLPDTLLKSVALKTQTAPKELVKNLTLKLPKPGKGKDKEPEPQVIQISYVNQDEKIAEQTLRELMSGMVEQSRLLNSLRLRTIIKSVNDRLPKVKKDLETAEQKLERYIRTEGPSIWAAEDGTLLSVITTSQQQQRQLKMNIAGIEAQMGSLQTKLGLNPEEAYTSSALSADPIIGNLRSQIYQNEAQLQLLSKDLRPEHPTMIDLRKKQEAFDEQLRQRAAEIMGGRGIGKPLASSKIRQDSSLDPSRQQLANTLVTLQTQRETLQQQLFSSIRAEQEARQEYVKIPNKQLEQARLQQQVELQKALYSKIQTSLADAKVAEAETVSSLSIAQPPKVVADIKTSPSLLLMVGAGSLVGILVGGAVIFFLSTLDAILYTPEELRAAFKDREIPLLGELPFVTIWDRDLGEIPILIEPDYVYLEYYERFRSNLRRVSEKPLKVILVTSTSDEEGKTVTAYNLGIASAIAGKRTLVIEADMRSPSRCRLLKVAPDPDATLEPLRYYSQLNECIRLVPDIQNLYIAPSPGPARQPAAILESSELSRLLEDARGRFDLVILDTPCLSNSNDALLLEPFSDGIVLVTRPGYTQGNFLGEAIEQLTEAELPLIGAIINGIEKEIPLPPATHDRNAETQQQVDVEPIQVREQKRDSKEAMKL